MCTDFGLSPADELTWSAEIRYSFSVDSNSFSIICATGEIGEMRV